MTRSKHFKESQKDIFESSPKLSIFMASSVVFQVLAASHGLIRVKRKLLKTQLNQAKMMASPLVRRILEESLPKE
jgi:hypothetical protein